MQTLSISTRVSLRIFVILFMLFGLCGNTALRPVTQRDKLEELSREFTRELEERRPPLYYDLLQSEKTPQKWLNENRDIQLMYIDRLGHPIYYTVSNLNAARTISTDDVWPGAISGLSWTGQRRFWANWPSGMAGECF